MIEHEPSEVKVAMFKVTCPIHGVLVDKMFLGATDGIIENHREFYQCDAVIAKEPIGYMGIHDFEETPEPQTYQALCVTHGAISPICVKPEGAMIFLTEHLQEHPACEASVYPYFKQTTEDDVERRR